MGAQMILPCPQGRIDETFQEQNNNIAEHANMATC